MSSVALVPRDAPCYDGSEVCFVDGDHFVYQAGAVLRVASARNGKTEGFIYPAEPCARGITAYCASSRGGLVALARRSVPPVIDVLCWPGAGAAEKDGKPPYKQGLLARERRAMARGGAGLEYGGLALSRNGQRLAAVSSVADAVLTVWDVPKAGNSDGSSFDSGGSVGSLKQITSGGEPVEPLEATFLASVELPTACDTVSFNPANPNMLLCTATSAHHDGVGGGHGGGCFIYKLATSHGHTSLTLVECNLTSLPDPHVPSESDENEGEEADGSQPDDESGWGTRRTNGGADRNDDNGSAASNASDDEGDDEDDDHAALQGHHSHAHGRLSVGAAVWGPGDVVYLGTGAGVVGRFDAATGALQCAWARGSSNKIAPSSVVGLVLTKDFLVVASKSRMLYWLDATELNSIEHTATVFGISNGAPPERIARLGHSPNYRYLVVATAEGTLHSHAIEPPADESKRSVSTGMPDILPISSDFHDGFVLCAASLAVARRGVQSDAFFTGGSDGTVRGWWAEDSSPAVARVFRALHPYDEDDDASSSYSGSESGSVESRGSRRSSRSLQPGSGGALEGLGAGEAFDTEDGNQALDEALQGMAEVQEDGSEHSNDDEDDNDSPDALSPVAVTSLAALPGRPVLAVGLADGQLSLLLAHSVTPLHSNGSLEAQLELLPLDLKQFSRRPVTHLAFSTPRRKEQVSLLAAGCATDGTIHIVEMAEPSQFESAPVDLEDTEAVEAARREREASLFRVIARIECAGSVDAHGHPAQHGKPPEDIDEDGHHHHHRHHHHHHHHHIRISSLCWSDPEILLVGTSDGALTAYAVPPPQGNNYSPEMIAHHPLPPLASVHVPHAAQPHPHREDSHHHHHAPARWATQIQIHPTHAGHTSHADLPPPIVQVLAIPSVPKSLTNAAENAVPGLAGGGLFVCTPAVTAPSLLASGPHGVGGWKSSLAAAHHGTVPSPHPGEFGLVAPSLPWAMHSSAKKHSSKDHHHSDASAIAATAAAEGVPDLSAGHPRGVTALALAPPGTGGHNGPGQLAMSGGLDGSLALWMLGGPDGHAPPQCINLVQPHTAPIVSLAFAPSGTAVISAALDRSVVVTTLTGLAPASLEGQGQETKFEAGAARNAPGSRGAAVHQLEVVANTKVLVDGFVRTALLRRASTLEAKTAAAKAQGEANRLSMISLQTNNELSPVTSKRVEDLEDKVGELALENLDGPLPSPGSALTWCESAKMGHIVGTGNSSQQGAHLFPSEDSDGNSQSSRRRARQSLEASGDDESDDEDYDEDEAGDVAWPQGSPGPGSITGTKSGVGAIKDNSAVIDLAMRLEDLLESNDNASELEKLNRHAFVVDVERRDATVAANVAKAAAVKASLLDADRVRDLVAGRVRQQAVASMEVPLTEVRSLHNTKMAVANMPLAKPKAAQARLLECAKRLRLVELREMRLVQRKDAAAARAAAQAAVKRPKGSSDAKHAQAVAAAGNAAAGQVMMRDRRDGAWPGRRDAVPQQVSWIVNEGTLTPVMDVVSVKKLELYPPDDGKKKKKGGDDGDGEGGEGKGGEEGAADDDDDEEDEDSRAPEVEMDFEPPPLEESSVLTYLYPPTALFTKAQRRLQVLFLQELERGLKHAYNVHVTALASAKADAVERIDERNTRLRDIAVALNLDPETESGAFVVPRDPRENPDDLLDVAESEMTEVPYETEAFKAAKAAAEAARLQAEAEAKKDNIGERALQDMMNGTLESKVKGALEKVMRPMPDWMLEFVAAENEEPGGMEGLAAMSETQREEYDAYLEEVAAFEAAAAAEKLALEEERDRLKAEIHDICVNFDAQVFQLHSLRVHASLAVATQGLYSLRLGVGVMQGEALAAAAAALHGNLSKLEAQKADLDAQADRWHAQVDAAKESLQVLSEEGNRLDKGCRRQLQEAAGEDNALPNDVMRHLLSLFNLRRSPPPVAEKKDADKAGRGGRRGQSSIVKKAKPSLMGAAGMMIGARREQREQGGFLGLLKKASKEDEAKKLADKADPFVALREAEDAAASASGSEAAKKKALEASAAEATALAPLNEEVDLPEGMTVPPLVWVKLNEQRQAKIKVELEIKAQSKKVTDMRKATGTIDKRDRAIAREVAHVQQQLDELELQASENAKDFELLCNLASGQNEMVEFDGSPSSYAAEVAKAEEHAFRTEKRTNKRQHSSSEHANAQRLDRIGSTASNNGYNGGTNRTDLQMTSASGEGFGVGRTGRIDSSASSYGNETATGLAVRDRQVMTSSSSQFGGPGASPTAGGRDGADGGGGGGGGPHHAHRGPSNDTMGVSADMEPLLAPPLDGGVLLPVSTLEKLNAQVQAVGQEKIKAMQRIKAFRKHLNLMVWEDSYRAAKIRDLEEFYSDLLLLRVEKSALAAMRGESKVLDATEASERAAARLAVAERAAQQRQAVVQQGVDKLRHSVREKRAENTRLVAQLRELEASVNAREAIYKTRAEAAGGELSAAASAAQRMKRVMMRRRLLDLAKAQTDEINFLRGELDRLRERTFPSFASAARHRLMPPDELM